MTDNTDIKLKLKNLKPLYSRNINKQKIVHNYYEDSNFEVFRIVDQALTEGKIQDPTNPKKVLTVKPNYDLDPRDNYITMERFTKTSEISFKKSDKGNQKISSRINANGKIYSSCNDDVEISDDVLKEIKELANLKKSKMTSKQYKEEVKSRLESILNKLITFLNDIKDKNKRSKHINEYVNLLQFLEKMSLDGDLNKKPIDKFPVATYLDGKLIINSLKYNGKKYSEVKGFISNFYKESFINIIKQKKSLSNIDIEQEARNILDQDNFLDAFVNEKYTVEYIHIDIGEIDSIKYKRMESIKDLIDFIESNKELKNRKTDILLSLGSSFTLNDIDAITKEDISEKDKGLVISSIIAKDLICKK